MARIFLSYRRDDSAGFAGRLADAMEAEFGAGSVFRDVDDIRPGEDFTHAIETHLQQVGVVLVMIGPRWLDADGLRRLDHTDDFVRQEIQAALESGKPLIPLLVGGASMPAEVDLPAAIAGLSRRQAVVLSDSNWRGNVERLVGWPAPSSGWRRWPGRSRPGGRRPPMSRPCPSTTSPDAGQRR
ncbi:MAG: toll/interleukin-1 receptor domain-containing protein [Thiobacillus sp.]|nr:toll/interleukin-1 receptor domain-containing protein [Thiobacillus sp.]